MRNFLFQLSQIYIAFHGESVFQYVIPNELEQHILSCSYPCTATIRERSRIACFHQTVIGYLVETSVFDTSSSKPVAPSALLTCTSTSSTTTALWDIIDFFKITFPTSEIGTVEQHACRGKCQYHSLNVAWKVFSNSDIGTCCYIQAQLSLSDTTSKQLCWYISPTQQS